MSSGFSDEQAVLLASVLDELVPPSGDGRLPGASEAGGVDHIARAIARQPELGPAIEDGLAALGAILAERNAPSLSALSADERAEVLEEVAGRAPAFLGGLTYQTYVGYYQHPRVLEGLGVPGRPPHPEGYELEVGDLSLLDPVRARPKLYRE